MATGDPVTHAAPAPAPPTVPMPATLAIYAGLCVIWSSTWVWIRVGLHGAPALTGAGVRFVLAGALLLAWSLARGQKVRLASADRSFVVLLSVILFAAPYGLVYAAEIKLTSGLAAVLFSCLPLFAVVIADRLLPDEPLSWIRLAGIGAGVGGLAVVFHGALALRAGTSAVLAMVGLLIAAALSAMAQVLIKRRGEYDWRIVLGWSSTLGGLLLLTAGLGALCARASARGGLDDYRTRPASAGPQSGGLAAPIATETVSRVACSDGGEPPKPRLGPRRETPQC